MKKHVSILSVILTAVIAVLPFCAPVRGGGDVTFVTESLSNYALGYMSWGVKHMGLDVMQEKLEKSGKTLPEVKVAVIDSGLNTSNKYLKNRYTSDGYNFLNNSTDINDDDYHGTMVSGIIADGTSKNVKVMPLKVNDASGKGNMKNVERAIYYAIEHNADVINMSISSEDPKRSITILDEAIAAAVGKGIVVIAAAGNQSGDTAYRYPANKQNVLTITSVNNRDKIAENANTGADVDFALPGVMIAAPYKRLMMVDSGTSLAAPHAAAAAALLKTWNKNLNQDGVVSILKQYAVDLGDKGFDNTYGWGMIDLSSFDVNAKPTEPATEPTTEPVTEPTTEPVTEPTTEPVAEPTTEPTTEPVTESATEPVTEPATEPTTAPVLIGDVNGDGIITISDATCIQQYLAGLNPARFRANAADTNGDGKITIDDATLLQKYIAKYDVTLG